MKRIFFFDFDGTITKRDSFLLFTFHAVGFIELFKYWSKTIFKIIFTSVRKGELKEQFFIDNFKNMSEEEFQIICNNFENKFFDDLIKTSFLNYLNNLDKKDEVVIVTASIKNYIKPWCNGLKIELISTELEIVNGKLTGYFSTPNCNHREKVNRIMARYDLKKYDDIYVFGDTEGDNEMMSLTKNNFYKFFK